MKKIITENKTFFIPFMFLWGVLSYYLLSYTKDEIHLWFNSIHNSFLDSIFPALTFLGDGLTPTIVAILLLFVSFRKAFIIGGGGILAGIFAQTLKRLAFPDMLRPKAYFQGKAELYFVPGVEVHEHFSFPSGHTIAAFSMFLGLAYLVKNKLLKFFFLTLALIAGYSRIYLSQHFLVDVYFGALVGCLAALISILIFASIQSAWLDKSLISILKKK